jgi:phosphoenolpyruvate carboxylase
MVNFYDKNRFISKSTLARLADVSPRTFSRYLATRRHILDAMGISPKAQKLPPQAVRYICEDYCIDLPPELQDQEALSKSPLYQNFLRMLQDREPFLYQGKP